MTPVDSAMTSLLPTCKKALDTFVSSPSSAFTVFRTIAGPAPSAAASRPRTLFILDSSFNPPQVAHLTLATTALVSRDLARYPRPHRLLLLFASHNADKQPAPASFEHRLAMMTLFAEDMAARIAETRPGYVEGEQGDDIAAAAWQAVPIDVGVTSRPYYNDKTAAIEAAGTYASGPKHVHLVGYDTFVRIFTARYYAAEHEPPFSALDDFMERHGLRITLRAGGDYGDEAAQRDFLERLRRGEMERDGGRREWAERIEMVDEDEEAVDVSSTDVRRAVQRRDWKVVDKLCTESVARWIKEKGLYAESESKMS